MRIGPLVLFEREVDDTVYAPAFNQALRLLRPTAYVLGDAGIAGTSRESTSSSGGDEIASHIQLSDKVLTAYTTQVQVAHNQLIDLWPRKLFRPMHRLLVAAIKSYGFALVDDIEYQRAILDGSAEAGSRFRRSALEWDKIAFDSSAKLVRQLRDLEAESITAAGSLVGDVDLDEIEDRLPLGPGRGHFIT